MSFSNFNANINFKHLNVVIMMRMTYPRFKQFYENVDMSMLWSSCRRGGRKGCHGNESENDATATYRFG